MFPGKTNRASRPMKNQELVKVHLRAIQEWVFEIHPEVCFWRIAGMRAMEHKKKSQTWRNERIEVLEKYVPKIGKDMVTRS